MFALVLLTSLLVVFVERESDLNAYQCIEENDCVKVQTTCCPCNMGGEEKCVAKSELAFYEEKLEECPENLACIALYNCKIDVCSCENGECSG
jgi:hypothetical protein